MFFHVAPSPVKEHAWACVDLSDAHCADVFALRDPTLAICKLQRSSWHWTSPERSILSQFDLICGKAWQAQLANSGFFMGYLIGSGVFGK
jgi:OCT family organic cation transporter-like MFS transporter 4/5